MAGPTLRLSNAALGDLSDIWRFIAQESQSIRTADKVADRIFDEFQFLLDNPVAGHLREDLTERPVRFWSIYNYLIAYQFRNDQLEVIRVLHTARDVATVLADE